MEEVKRIDTDKPKHKCYNCGNSVLLKKTKDSWSTVIKCIICKKETHIIYSDKMSGAFTDTVIVYSP